MSRKTSSSAPSCLVARGHLDRIAGVAEVDEIRPLDHPAPVDVEAGNDTFGKHRDGRADEGIDRADAETRARAARPRRYCPEPLL